MMSTVIPVCACCEKPSQVSISCTKCFQICCSSCIDIPAFTFDVSAIDATARKRLCRNCNKNTGTIDTGTMGQPRVLYGYTGTLGQPNSAKRAANRGDQNLCQLHQKVRKIFCLNCSKGICGTCMDAEDQHSLHQITNLAVIYREKLATVKSKMIQVEQCNNVLRSNAIVYERNLLLLEEEESSVRTEIDAIAEASRLEVFNATKTHKQTLRQKLEHPTVVATRLTDLRSKVGQLSENEFVQQFPKIDTFCDKLIGFCVGEGFELQNVGDIKCDLIPPYQFKWVVYKGFLNTEIGSKQVFKLKSTHDVEWKLTASKSGMLQLTASPTDPQVLAFRHMLIVVIPHPDYTKEIHQAFELNEHGDTLQVAQTIHLLEQGFCNDNGDLVMKIGIRPRNTIIEKELLDYQYRKLSQRLQSIIDKHDHNHLVMHFKLKLSEVQNRNDLFSHQIIDSEDRHWRMNVKLEPNYVVGIYVQLFKGTTIKCGFFVELKHNDPTKTVVKVEERRHFDKSVISSWGWKSFISWGELSNDAGFHPDGYLHFRFGVRPLPTV